MGAQLVRIKRWAILGAPSTTTQGEAIERTVTLLLLQMPSRTLVTRSKRDLIAFAGASSLILLIYILRQIHHCLGIIEIAVPVTRFAGLHNHAAFRKINPYGISLKFATVDCAALVVVVYGSLIAILRSIFAIRRIRRQASLDCPA
jgi:hypothetical protein